MSTSVQILRAARAILCEGGLYTLLPKSCYNLPES